MRSSLLKIPSKILSLRFEVLVCTDEVQEIPAVGLSVRWERREIPADFRIRTAPSEAKPTRGGSSAPPPANLVLTWTAVH